MAKNRNLEQLAQEWDSLTNDADMVAFVNSLTYTECEIIDRAHFTLCLSKQHKKTPQLVGN